MISIRLPSDRRRKKKGRDDGYDFRFTKSASGRDCASRPTSTEDQRPEVASGGERRRVASRASVHECSARRREEKENCFPINFYCRPTSRRRVSVMAKHWIQKAIKHPGVEKKAAARAGESTHQYMEQHKNSPGKAGARARLGLRLSAMSKRGK